MQEIYQTANMKNGIYNVKWQKNYWFILPIYNNIVECKTNLVLYSCNLALKRLVAKMNQPSCKPLKYQ